MYISAIQDSQSLHNTTCQLFFIKDDRRCVLCNRPISLYNIRDPKHCVQEWCGVCNWHCKFPEFRRLVKYRLWKILPAASVTFNVVLNYLVGNDLRLFKEDAWFTCWSKILLRGPYNYDLKNYNHSSHVEWSLYHFGDRPLWLLKVSRKELEPGKWFGKYGRPFKILTTMLGRPPLDIGQQYAVRDDRLCTTI